MPPVCSGAMNGGRGQGCHGMDRMIQASAVFARSLGSRNKVREYSRWGTIEDGELVGEICVKKQRGIDPPVLPKIHSQGLIDIVKTKKKPGTFKKLEFLGDAYIEFIVSVLLFEKSPMVPKNILVEAVQDMVSNRTLGGLAERCGLLKPGGRVVSEHKAQADIVEAYFGAVALESGISTRFNRLTHGLWHGWHSSSTFLHEVSKQRLVRREFLSPDKIHRWNNRVSVLEEEIGNPERHLMHLRNNSMKDLNRIFNTAKDDHEARFEVEKLEFLGNSALRFFLTKLYIDNLTSHAVGKLARMRDIGLRADKVALLSQRLWKIPTGNLAYNVFRKEKSAANFEPKANHVKQYLGYITATHYLDIQNVSSTKLFQIGWSECEALVKLMYNDHILKEFNKEKARNPTV